MELFPVNIAHATAKLEMFFGEQIENLREPLRRRSIGLDGGIVRPITTIKRPVWRRLDGRMRLARQR
jgi:hypothetical protein